MGKPRWEYVYGINPCFEVIRGGRRKIHEAFLVSGCDENPRLRKLKKYLVDKAIPLTEVGRDRLFQLCTSTEHQGAVLRTSLYPYATADVVFEKSKLLLLDNVEDPHNVGAILRSAEIFGFTNIALPVKGVPEIYPSIIKVSAGATEHLTICRDHSANEYVKRAKAEGYTVIALDEEGKVSLSDIKVSDHPKILLVIGGEGKSVGQFIIMNADIVASIPQKGRINSLNASVAAGIALYAIGGGNAS